MAYKFQRGEAILSGALLQEGDVEIESGFSLIIGSAEMSEADLEKLDGITDGTAAASKALVLDSNKDASGVRNFSIEGALSASTNLEIGGTVRLDGVADATAAVADDMFYIMDDSDQLVKAAGMADVRDLFFGAVSGDATVAAGGALTISADSVEGTMLNTNAADGTTMELSSDSLSVLKVPNALSQGEGVAAFSFDGSGTATVGLSASVAGDGLSYSSGVLAVGVHGNGGIEIASDSLQLNIDGMDDLGGASIAQDDEFAMSDAGTVKKVNFSDFEDSIFANISGDATIAAGGALTIAADSVEGTMLNTNAADGTTLELSSDSLSVLAVPNALSQGEGIAAFSFDGSSALTIGLSASVAGDGLAYSSGVLSLDLDELTAADVNVAADFIAIVDADDNSTKKESVADLVSAMAGAGLTATDGVLKVTGNDVHSKADGDTLQEGYNYFADASADAAVTLPASPSAGDVVHVKAGDLTSDAVITISRAGSHLIDGETSIVLESPFAAVSLVYVAANAWRIV